MSTRVPIQFDIVDEAVSEQVKTTGSGRPWVALLEDGKMLRMPKRPQWLKSDKVRTGMKMRTRAVNDGTSDCYVWLVPDESVNEPQSIEADLHGVLAS